MSLAHQPAQLTEPAPVERSDRTAARRFMAYKWAVSLLVAIPGLFVYEYIGALDLGRSVSMLDTPLDRAIPLMPWTVWFYEPFYVSIFVIAVIGFRTRLLFHCALVGIIFNKVVAAFGHYFIRAEGPRPVLVPPYPDLSTAFLAFVYQIDPPGNVFPSLHVAHPFVLAFILSFDRPKLGRVTMVMATVLAVSTLTTKQHFIADVLAGLAMALVARLWTIRQITRSNVWISEPLRS